MKYLIALLLSSLILFPSDGLSQVTNIVYTVGDNGTILELVDGQWFTLDPGIVVDIGTLQDIWGSSSDNIYITGSSNELLHYNGFDWQKITIPDATPAYPDLLHTVDGTGPDNLFVGGYESSQYTGVGYHYDGVEWTYCGGPPYQIHSSIINRATRMRSGPSRPQRITSPPRYARDVPRGATI